MTIHGSCVCGAVRYAIDGDGFEFQYCFCSRCRKKSGSSYAANLFVYTNQLSWVQGEEKVRRYELPTAKYWATCFCEDCGSAMPWLSRTGKAWIVPAGGLDEAPEIRPRKGIFFGSKAEWYTHADALALFEEYPPREK
ncbi:MAG: GFA family protein [Deltaproteobacteria bacterium]|nr:MAG: GFA family protein [Deltaproteobacteria bacterium]